MSIQQIENNLSVHVSKDTIHIRIKECDYVILKKMSRKTFSQIKSQTGKNELGRKTHDLLGQIAYCFMQR